MAHSLKLALPMLLLCACSDGGRGRLLPEGTFVDSAVQGVQTRSGANTGVTDENGAFRYVPGTMVEFRIGDIFIGRAPGDDVVTPVDLVNGAEDESDPAVANISRFLQTLDVDANPDNGIRIPAAVLTAARGRTMSFAQTTAEFAADPNVQAVVAALTTHPLVSAGDARTHLRRTLQTGLAGFYEGTFDGDQIGRWELFVDPAGNIVGTGIHTPLEGVDPFPISGSIASSGSLTLTASLAEGDAMFTGRIQDGRLRGDWTLEAAEETESGQVRGSRTFGGPWVDPARVAAFVGTYAGTASFGATITSFTLSVGARGDLVLTIPGVPAAAAVFALDGTSLRLRGIDDAGSRFDATITTAGRVTGDVWNALFGLTGTLEGTRI